MSRKKWTRKPLESKAITVTTDDERETYLTIAAGRFPTFLGFSYTDQSYSLIFEYIDPDGDPDSVRIELDSGQAQGFFNSFGKRVPELPIGCDLEYPPPPAPDDPPPAAPDPENPENAE